MSLVGDVQEGIRAFDRGTGEELPDLRQLAREMGVSLSTVSRAVAHLRSEGLVVSRGRGGTRFTSGPTLSAATTIEPSARRKLHDELVGQIRQGVVRVGDVLPKLSYFTIDRGLTARSVRAVYDRLCREELAHRVGRRWVVGPAAPRIHVGPNRERPVVLIVTPSENDWRNVSQIPEVQGFAYEFNKAIGAAGLLPLPVLTQRVDSSHLSGAMVQGKDAARRLIRRLGDRLRGILVPCTWEDTGEPRTWARLLCDASVPVVWTGFWQPEQMAFRMRNLHGCFVDEDSAAALVAEVLGKSGHRVAGAVQTRNTTPRLAERIDCLRRKLSPNTLRVEVYRETQPFWEERDDGEVPAETIRRLRMHGTPVVKRIFERLLERSPELLSRPDLQTQHPDLWTNKILSDYDMGIVYLTPLLGPLLTAYSPTVLIVANEWSAIATYYWLCAHGIHVPSHVSLLVYGNGNNLHPLPVSAIDLGYGEMGYMAAHLMIGDIPSAGTVGNRMRAPVRFIDRGSLSSSPTTPFRLHLSGQLR